MSGIVGFVYLLMELVLLLFGRCPHSVLWPPTALVASYAIRHTSVNLLLRKSIFLQSSKVLSIVYFSEEYQKLFSAEILGITDSC